MSTLSDRLYAQARITPIRKLAGGAMRVSTHGGESYEIPAGDIELHKRSPSTPFSTTQPAPDPLLNPRVRGLGRGSNPKDLGSPDSRVERGMTMKSQKPEFHVETSIGGQHG